MLEEEGESKLSAQLYEKIVDCKGLLAPQVEKMLDLGQLLVDEGLAEYNAEVMWAEKKSSGEPDFDFCEGMDDNDETILEEPLQVCLPDHVMLMNERWYLYF